MNTAPVFCLPGIALALLAGCASHVTGPATMEAVPAARVASHAGADLEVTVEAVVVPANRDAWSRGACWDEYALTLTNRGGSPLVIESAVLVDVRHAELAPGDHPGKLEKLSRTRWTRYVREGVPVNPQAADPSAAQRDAVDRNAPLQALGWTLALAAPPAALLGVVAVAATAGATERRAIKSEFQKRRLKLPLSLAAEQQAAGSFFFPVTPGPQRLVVAYRCAGELHREAIALPALADLHLPPRTVIAQAP